MRLPTVTNNDQQEPTVMKHTNEIIIGVLKETHSDYTENNWHYNNDYIMIEKAINKALSQQVQEKDKAMYSNFRRHKHALFQEIN
ncbi:MAG: hypothetical protein HRT69_16980 [Flavobacteriaceae bacterium]|nr:hypothetical protein [Flavobacteriaceae bacterium]